MPYYFFSLFYDPADVQVTELKELWFDKSLMTEIQKVLWQEYETIYWKTEKVATLLEGDPKTRIAYHQNML